MQIYYFMLEAYPCSNNPEFKKHKGAYINCWVKAKSFSEAYDKVIDYLAWEKWELKHIEDSFIANREQYLNIPESLDCYDYACEHGINAIFYLY